MADPFLRGSNSGCPCSVCSISFLQDTVLCMYCCNGPFYVVVFERFVSTLYRKKSRPMFYHDMPTISSNITPRDWNKCSCGQ